MNNQWIEHDRGFIVNIYQIGKMFQDSSVSNIISMMSDAYIREFGMPFPHDGNPSFDEFVNEKRKFLAGVLGKPEFY